MAALAQAGAAIAREGPSMCGFGHGITGEVRAVRRAAAFLALAVWTVCCNGGADAVPPAPSASPAPGASAAPALPVRGAYTFSIDADPGGTCGWPMTTFVWPVTVEVASYVQGITAGAIVFPPAPSLPSNRWTLHAGPTGTLLVPAQGSPGAAAAAYDLVVEGGRWEAGAPTRAPDGRGEIASGAASGARLTLAVAGSSQRRECRSEARWSLRIRWVDRD